MLEVNFSNEKVRFSGKHKVFLAGPTVRDSEFKYSWRRQAIDILEEIGYNGMVYVPEFSINSQRDYVRQVQWEREALTISDTIAFWFCRDIENGIYGFTSNVEFGMYIERYTINKKFRNILLGHPENADKMRYIDYVYEERTKKKPVYTLQDLMENVNTTSKET